MDLSLVKYSKEIFPKLLGIAERFAVSYSTIILLQHWIQLSLLQLLMTELTEEAVGGISVRAVEREKS